MSADWSSVATGDDDPVDRHHLPLANRNPVAGDERLDRHLRKTIVAVTEGGLGDAAEQSGHLAPRAALREVFEQLPARNTSSATTIPASVSPTARHARHRQRRDDVEADAALPELGDNFEQQGERTRRVAPPGIQAAKSG